MIAQNGAGPGYPAPEASAGVAVGQNGRLNGHVNGHLADRLPSWAPSERHVGNGSIGPSQTLTDMGVRVSVVIPTLNEAGNLPHVFARLPQGLHEVIVVDGRSVDDTVGVARRLLPDVIIVLEKRRGKGNALAAGFAACTGDVIVTLDADGSADAGEIPRFVAALCHGADFVKGSRFAQGGASSDITRLRKAGNRAP